MVKWSEISGGEPVAEDFGVSRPSTPGVFRDLEIVRLTDDFAGGRIPKGAQGTILQVFEHGHAYQV